MRLFFEDSDLPQAAPTGASDAGDLLAVRVLDWGFMMTGLIY
ncbi:hypothetical protein Hdeb2414_s0002g00047131 [Helianthus debilis subsp. tardiflorus]